MLEISLLVYLPASNLGSAMPVRIQSQGKEVYLADSVADTWALYGPASYLLDGGKDGQHKYVDDNGQINPLDNATKRVVRAVKGAWKKFVA
jgi:hypothetical protein